MKILMVMTSHGELGDTGEKTGIWLEEFAAPYYAIKDAGHEVALASPKGGQPPIDPRSEGDDSETEATRRFRNDPEAQAAFDSTRILADIDVSQYDGIFYPGGHGPLWDLVNDSDSKTIIETALANDTPVALVCHAPAVLKNVVSEAGEPIAKGRKLTGFTNSEEEAVGLTDTVPFLLEDVLRQQGGNFSCSDDFTPHVVTDGLLVTGQNPPSSAPTAEALLRVLAEQKEPA
ncbi:type 1 glutamine amidotransferase domain-containing protein [Sphingomicrobium marinum]|uniref:type 1 glutamine amidotransferase domain-containing protein n=1 Tax=Sphingomicrobium marinum TaxID=1227950 RepID=UPI00223E9E0F|nr:type 1 glutamine amidotransferase domain-containing protein [Sphingomicrobium marinum]